MIGAPSITRSIDLFALDFPVILFENAKRYNFQCVNSDIIPIRTVPQPVCILCGGKGELLYANMRDRLYGTAGNWGLKQCADPECGLVWLDPAPHEADLHLLYTTYLTHEHKGTKPRVLFWLRSLLYNGYLMASYIPSTLLGIQKARQSMSSMFLNDLKPGKLLDVGCGAGSFLNRMHNAGWSVTGIDFDPKAIENVKTQFGSEVTALHSDLFGAKFPDSSFDAVTMNHVIEHVPDPIALLSEVRRILKTGGRLVIITPNLRSYGHGRFRDSWWGLDSPRHLQVFSLNALKQCARKAGFEKCISATSVANADNVFGGSFSFLQAKINQDFSSATRISFNFLRGIRSLLLQYKEALLLRHDPECGEEAVLICQK